MPRKPKAKNALSAGERVALYEAAMAEKKKEREGLAASAPIDSVKDVSREADVRKTAPFDGCETSAEPKKKDSGTVKVKPKSATVRVDFSIPTGSIKPMHGMCNGPVSYGADISGLFKEIGVPQVRFDGTDTAIGGVAVDISRIFKNFDADPADPESYDFAATDRYVEAALLSGAKVIYRLGESCDLFGNKRGSTEILDIDLLSRVCVNVVRHYNGGWAGGAHYGIEYFEIWNMGDDTASDVERYGRLANAVKMYDESLKVGGMSFDSVGAARDFLKTCKKRRNPVDFITLDCFADDIEEVTDDLDGLVASAKNLGFDSLEIILGRWMLVDGEATGGLSLKRALGSARFSETRRDVLKAQRSVKGASYCAALMLALCNKIGVSSACFYDAQPAVSPFCSLTDDLGTPQKPFYAFRAFGELYRAKNAVLCSVDRQEGMAHSGVYAAAALSDSGEGVFALASFGGPGVIDVRLDGLLENHYSADVYMLDGVKNMELVDSVPITGMKKRLVLNVSEYGAVLIKLH